MCRKGNVEGCRKGRAVLNDVLWVLESSSAMDILCVMSPDGTDGTAAGKDRCPRPTDGGNAQDIPSQRGSKFTRPTMHEPTKQF